ncbi:MAG TPA: nitroreductase family protein [Acidimicrobiales bacterium]|nr:nitroreductase family protein [Acidimicrobiales bacterium]
MELSEVLRRRRMVRSFDDRPLAAGTVDRLLGAAIRAPSAGFTQGWAFVVLEGVDTERFWRRTLPPPERAGFRWPGLLRAPVLVLPLSSRQAYLDRYAEADKTPAALHDSAAWPVPYWDVDCAFATMVLLLAAVDEGLGALFFGIFRGEAEVLADLGVPPEFWPIGAVALGHPAGDDPPSASVARGRKPLDEVVHRGRW